MKTIDVESTETIHKARFKQALKIRSHATLQRYLKGLDIDPYEKVLSIEQARSLLGLYWFLRAEEMVGLCGLVHYQQCLKAGYTPDQICKKVHINLEEKWQQLKQQLQTHNRI